MINPPSITLDSLFNKLDQDVLLLEEKVAQTDASLTAKGDQILNELMEICAGNTEEQRIFERLTELELEETDLQNKYYTDFNLYTSTKREWMKRIIACLRETDTPNHTPQRFAQSVTSSTLLKKLLDNPPISIVKDNIENFGTFDLLFSEIRIDKKKPLGKGGYGEVHEGHCRGVLVAVKTLTIALDPTAIENFKRECTVMKTAVHTNILLFMGACQQPNHLYLVTELAPRGSLDRYLHQKDDLRTYTKLNFFQKMKACREVARGMNWLHKQNILHLDLKPANLLLMEDWTVKIADFGLSRLKPSKNQMEECTGVAGTIYYMPPEALSLKPVITTKCDVYAYGIVLWEVATECKPFDNKYLSFGSIMQAVRDRHERPEMNESTFTKITKSLAVLIEQCWHKDPDLRPSFDEILAPTGEGDTDVFDTVFAEYVAAGRDKDLDGKIAKMWEDFGKEVNAVPWEKFEDAFSRLMNTKPKDPNMSSLKAWLNVAENSDMVTSNTFIHFVQMFAPLEPTGGAKMSTLEAVSQIVKEKWFWGECKGGETTALLRKNGTYLVRFSETYKGAFTLSYRHQNQILNKRLNCTPATLKDKVKEEKKVLRLKKPPLGRPAKFVNAAIGATSANYIVMGVSYGNSVDTIL